MSATRGERNNNPGNIRLGSNWLGLAPKQVDGVFCQFTDVKYGIRALAKVLLQYKAQGRDTVDAIITRWAPDVENNTAAYIAAVASNMGVAPDDILDVAEYARMFPLVSAIIRHENGRVIYPRNIIDSGLSAAGVNA